MFILRDVAPHSSAPPQHDTPDRLEGAFFSGSFGPDGQKQSAKRRSHLGHGLTGLARRSFSPVVLTKSPSIQVPSMRPTYRICLTRGAHGSAPPGDILTSFSFPSLSSEGLGGVEAYHHSAFSSFHISTIALVSSSQYSSRFWKIFSRSSAVKLNALFQMSEAVIPS